jgi:glycerate 2-kinase
MQREVFMHIVVAPQALKGSLTAAAAGQAIVQGVLAVYPDAEVSMIPIADGGEGTVQALVDATGGELISQTVTGPLGEPVTAFWGLLGDKQTAAIEMAASSGLPLVPQERRDPRITTTFGFGELIYAALEHGCRHFIIGLGGSATNDGGAGMAQALGATLTTADGQTISRGGAALAALSHISAATMDPRLQSCTFDVACDVSNLLCGPLGASAVYGPQKGATPEVVAELDRALAHYAHIIERDLQVAVSELPGAGAAGGLGAGVLAFLHAALRPGAQIVLEALHLEDYLRAADLVITAEGQLDVQTAYGKSIAAVASLAQRFHLPVLALAGGLGEGYRSVYDLGVSAVTVIPSGPMSLNYAMEHAAALTCDATERALRIMRVGTTIN